MRFIHIYILMLTFSPYFVKGQNQYVRVKAKSGDGIYVLLGRYGLDRSQCNIDRFCELNKLTLKSYLITDKTYLLPIEKYVYDGNSIESSLNRQDSYLAKQVERYNRSMCSFKLKPEDHRVGSKELWCPHHLLACNNSNREEFVPNDRSFEIFGKKYAEVALEDKSLAGAVYYIVSGHGGPDPGAMATESGKRICEDEYAYDIALRLGRELLRHGAIVHFITRDEDGIRDNELLNCDSDEVVKGDLTIPFNQSERLKQRSDIINELYRKYKNKGIDYQRTIEIHIDSRKANQRVDLFFYHFPNSSMGKSLAELLYKTVKSKYAIYRKNGEYDGSVTARDLHVLREAIPTTVFIEVANIQNAQDRKRIVLPQNRQFLAEWLAEGLLKDY
jgi:N-acetylmuramoyl-L-alanine amidase